MKVVFLPTIFYECVIEQADGASKSKFFISRNPLRSREHCLNYFLETWLADETLNAEDMFLTIYMRHLASGQRIEILSSVTYEYGMSTLSDLEREFACYQKEGIKADLALWNHRTPQLVSILPNKHLCKHETVRQDSSTFLAHNYWLFVPAKQETMLFA